MRVALCTETMYPMYGVGRLVYETAKRLSEHGIDPVIYSSTPPRLVPDVKMIQVSNPTTWNPPKRNYAFCLQFMASMFRKLLKADCDIIDAKGHLALLPCSAAAKLTGKPSIASIYDVYTSQWGEMYKGRASVIGPFFEMLSFKAPFSKYIVINSSNKRQLEECFGIDERKINVLPHAIDMNYLDSVQSDKKKNVLFTGRLVPQKNVGLLIRAFAALPEELKNEYCLRIIGTGSEMPQLKRLATDLDTNVTFLGDVQKHTDVLKEMRSAEVFVMPSVRESLGIAILEAMACKAAVVSTATEGPVDYIKNGKNGFLTPIGNRQALTEALEQLLSNKRLRDRVAANGRKTAEEHDMDNGIKKLIQLYEQTIRSH